MFCQVCNNRGFICVQVGHDPYPDKPRDDQRLCPENCERSKMIVRSREQLGNKPMKRVGE